MTIQEVYKEIGGDYEMAIGRMRLDKMVSRFVVMFLDDPSSNRLIDAWDSGDERAIFEAAHTVKGVCGNLSLTDLQNTSSMICEAYREGNEALRATTDSAALMEEFKAKYAHAVEVIKAFAAEQ